jgi:hypothetical protein
VGLVTRLVTWHHLVGADPLVAIVATSVTRRTVSR